MRTESRAATDPFLIQGHPAGFSVGDFCQWGMSDLAMNTIRAAVAEFLISKALGCSEKVRNCWGGCDLVSPDGLRIEVKSSAYWQAWKQEAPSAITFGIAPATEWCGETNTWTKERKRNSDVYVFCVFNNLDHKEADPTEISFWDFYILPAETLNEAGLEQASIGLNSLLRLQPIKCRFEELRWIFHERTGGWKAVQHQFQTLSYYGLFKPHGKGMIRLDTRIYLNGKPSDRDEGTCVGAFVGKNPGSANGGTTAPETWGPMGDDPTLKTIGECFQEAYDQANRQIPQLAYVQVWNLFYWCNPKFKDALSQCDAASLPRCETESMQAPVVWFGWGRQTGTLWGLGKRFQHIAEKRSFYFDWGAKELKLGRPGKNVCAKHPQRWDPTPVIVHLAKILGRRS